MSRRGRRPSTKRTAGSGHGPDAHDRIVAFLETVHPYDSLPRDELARVAGSFSRREYRPAAKRSTTRASRSAASTSIKRGAVEVLDPTGDLVSLLGPRNSFGERGLMRDGVAVTTARATEDSVLSCCFPAPEFRR